MAFDTESKLTGLFDQAVSAFSDSLKAGVKMQEQVAKAWTEALEQKGSVGELQKKGKAMVEEVIPTAKKNAEEWIALIDTNYKRSAELLKKAFAAEGNNSKADVEAKTRELWESSVSAIRDSAKAFADTNMRVMQLWSDAAKKTSENAQGK